MRLQRAVDIFLTSYDNRGTRKAYRQTCDLLVETLGAGTPVAQVASTDLVEFKAAVADRPFAPATQRKHVKNAKTFFNWLVKMELIESSPAKVITARQVPCGTKGL